MIKCPLCGATKSPTEFYWRKGRPRVAEGCKPCYYNALTSSYGHSSSPENQTRRAERNAKSMDKATHRRQLWTSDDDELVAAFYGDPDITVEELAAELGRTVSAVGVRACRLRKHRELVDRRTALMKNQPDVTR